VGGSVAIYHHNILNVMNRQGRNLWETRNYLLITELTSNGQVGILVSQNEVTLEIKQIANLTSQILKYQ
jgi:hypothetical protein